MSRSSCQRLDPPPDWEETLTGAMLEALPFLPAFLGWLMLVWASGTESSDNDTGGLALAGLMLGLLHFVRGLGWLHLDQRKLAALAFLCPFPLMFAWLVALLAYVGTTDCMGCSSSDGREELVFVWLFAISIIASPLVSATVLIITSAPWSQSRTSDSGSSRLQGATSSKPKA